MHVRIHTGGKHLNAVGTGVIKSLTSIKKQIQKQLLAHSTFMKNKKDPRNIKKSWRLANSELFECLTPNIDINKFDDIERKFYQDQKDKWEMFLSEENDLEYELSFERKVNESIEAENCIEAKLRLIFGEEEVDEHGSHSNTSMHNTQEESDLNLNLSMNRSGSYRLTPATHTIGIKADLYIF